MKIRIDLSAEDIRRKIESEALYKKRQNGFSIWSFTQSDKDKFIGEVGGNWFWLQKTKAFYTQIPQRYFTGEIIDHSDHVIIQGHFRYTSLARAVSIIFWLVALGGYTLFRWGLISKISI